MEHSLVEVITEQSAAPGRKHAPPRRVHREIAIRSWQGEPDDPVNELGGVGWIRAVEWIPYQASNFVTPPFPGYTSGHSTFSRAGAEVLAAFTGSDYFPGGLGVFVAEQDDYLDFEQGPSETVVLQWATYADAADEAGLSRRFGGIHPYYDDFPGRVQGADIGHAAWARAQQFYAAAVEPAADVAVCLGAEGQGQTQLVDSVAAASLQQLGFTLGACFDGASPEQPEIGADPTVGAIVAEGVAVPGGPGVLGLAALPTDTTSTEPGADAADSNLATESVTDSTAAASTPEGLEAVEPVDPAALRERLRERAKRRATDR